MFAEPDRLADRSLGGHDAQLAYGEVPFVKELERRLPYCAGRADYRDCLFARHRFDPIISTPALSRPRLYRENHRQSISFRRATAPSPRRHGVRADQSNTRSGRFALWARTSTKLHCNHLRRLSISQTKATLTPGPQLC